MTVDGGSLVNVIDSDRLPISYVDQAPRTKARFAFLAGALNKCFLAESQERLRLATDAAGLVTYWNRHAEQLYGWDDAANRQRQDRGAHHQQPMPRRALAERPGLTWPYRDLAAFLAHSGDLAGAADALQRSLGVDAELLSAVREAGFEARDELLRDPSGTPVRVIAGA